MAVGQPRFFGDVVVLEDERGSHVNGLAVGDLLGEPIGFGLFTIFPSNNGRSSLERRSPPIAHTVGTSLVSYADDPPSGHTLRSVRGPLFLKSKESRRINRPVP